MGDARENVDHHAVAIILKTLFFVGGGGGSDNSFIHANKNHFFITTSMVHFLGDFGVGKIARGSWALRGSTFLSHRKCLSSRFAKVNSRINPSTYPLY